MGLFAGTKWDLPPRCDRCQQLEAECVCPPPESLPKVWLDPSKQTAKVFTEKRAKGKWVSVIRGLKPSESDFATLLTSSKTHVVQGGLPAKTRSKSKEITSPK